MKESISKLKRAIIKSNRIRLIIAVSFLVVLFIICAVIFISQKNDVNKLQVQYSAYQQQLEEQQKENDQLENIIQSDNLDDYMEQKARERGYIKSGEIVFYDISGSN